MVCCPEHGGPYTTTRETVEKGVAIYKHPKGFSQYVIDADCYLYNAENNMCICGMR